MKKLILSMLLLTLSPAFLTKSHASSIKQAKCENKPTLELYYLPWCPYSQKVSTYLESIHKSVPLINLQKNPQGREDLMKIGGKAQVPCLIINGHPLYESTAIIKWLSENKDCLDPA